jgi:uncharacterized protein (TIGR04255 family)
MISVRFTQPPVREVSLTVLWEPFAGLLAADVGDLLGKLRDKYPEVTERPAMAPWTEPELPGIQILSDDKVLPYCWWIADDERNRLVRFQFDRLILSWRHTPGGGAYPEYIFLRQELEELFAVAAQWFASKRPGEDLESRVKRAQIDYVNQLDYGPADLLCGVLTDWTGRRSGDYQSRSPNVTATWDVEVENPDVNATIVRFDADGQDGSTLTIVSTTDKDGEETYADALDRVHGRSCDVFLSITPDELQQKWGRRD